MARTPAFVSPLARFLRDFQAASLHRSMMAAASTLPNDFHPYDLHVLRLALFTGRVSYDRSASGDEANDLRREPMVSWPPARTS
jgi:hypothetical protein